MLQEISITGPHKDFESIKEIDNNGVEYWTARELMSVLGYSTWRSFEDVVKKAQQACVNSRQFPQDHFADVGKMTKIGHGIARRLDDYKLDRYACYLIAQNGDPGKVEIAMAQTYFAIQARKQEIFDNLSDTDKRIHIREEVTDRNKQLFTAAKAAGVSRFGLFNDAGYRGLYGMPVSEVERIKGIGKGDLLDRAGSTELAANLFRITQTEAKLKKDGVKDELTANRAHFMVGGKVRQTIKDIGGESPEYLKPEKHIEEIKKEKKLLEKPTKKFLQK